MKKRANWLLRIKSSGVAITLIGFFSFLVIAAFLMLILESSESKSGINNLFQSLWFSIVTITTVGYGDLSPLSSLGKVAAIVIMFIGIVYIGVLTGNITSWLVERNRKNTLGLVPIKKKERHFLILGWRQGMTELLKDILFLHQQDSQNVVLVNNTDAKEVNELRQDPNLRHINFFSGDYTNREVLLNACGNRAARVLVLADERWGKTAEEVDFKTVLATIAVKRINPHIYSIVEIIQPKFSLYLQHVGVEEIILNRFSSQALICNIALMSGMNSVFRRLFAMDTGILNILAVPQDVIGKTYKELKAKVHKSLVIGIIENTGNLRIRKQEKMNHIQKSVSISKAIQGLMEIKHLESNLPLFHPAPNYTIKENSAIIVLDVNPGELNIGDCTAETSIGDGNIIRSSEELIKDQIIKLLEKSDNWNSYIEMMKRVNLEIYRYRYQVSGVIHKNQKITFESLAIPSHIIQKINDLYKKKPDKKALIYSKFNSLLDKAYDWDELNALLELEGIKIYFYRKKANGLVYDDKRYSFQTLGVEQDIVEELRKHIQIPQESGKQVPLFDPDEEYLTLSAFMNKLKSKDIIIKPKSERDPKILMICGWKPQLIEMLNFIITQYPSHSVEWDKISVVADVDRQTKERFYASFPDSTAIKLYQGEIANREVLKKAGIVHATKVVILAETDLGKSHEEIDAQTVLTAMLIGSMNKRAYKVAEILDNRYQEALEQANVEEIYLEDEFTRIMLANASHGLGVTRVLRELVNLDRTILEIVEIDKKHIHGSFRQLLREATKPGKMVLGLLEETGNLYARKTDKIMAAQIQSNIKEQVEELIKVKELIPNNVVVAPSPHYKISSNSKLIILKTSDVKGWETYQKYIS